MKLQIIKTVVAERPTITFQLFPENSGVKFNLTFSYTCPECAGHGCNNHRLNNQECNLGTVSKQLDPSTMNHVFSPHDLQTIRAIFHSLNEAIQTDAP